MFKLWKSQFQQPVKQSSIFWWGIMVMVRKNKNNQCRCSDACLRPCNTPAPTPHPPETDRKWASWCFSQGQVSTSRWIQRVMSEIAFDLIPQPNPFCLSKIELSDQNGCCPGWQWPPLVQLIHRMAVKCELGARKRGGRCRTYIKGVWLENWRIGQYGVH